MPQRGKLFRAARLPSPPLYRLAAVVVAALVVLAAPAAAVGDKRLTASPYNQYATPNVTMDQGERLTFQNLDFNNHDVVATERGPDGRPLFATPLIPPPQEVFVEGSQYLTAGSYPFFCSIHTFMRGTLTVTTAGTPVPRPGGGGSGGAGGGGSGSGAASTALEMRILDRAARIRRSGRLRVSVRVDRAGTVTLDAALDRRGRVVRLGRATARFDAAGTRTVTIRVGRAGRRALRRPGRATLKVSGRVGDTGTTASAPAR